jgi:acetolactate synthase I/II/III large subunit
MFAMTASPQAAPNGAECLIRTLVAGGVEVCFANPGTSEMHFVSALDRVEGMRGILFLSGALRRPGPFLIEVML